jgi:hypothetical protein
MRTLHPVDIAHLPAEETSSSPRGRGLDTQRRRAAADIVGEARCPCCRSYLIARLNEQGPYFHCRCLENPGERVV